MPQTKRELIDEYEQKLMDWKREAGRFRTKYLDELKEIVKLESSLNSMMSQFEYWKKSFEIMLKVNITLWFIVLVMMTIMIIKLW